MSLSLIHKNIVFGIGDKIRITQSIKDRDKERNQHFDGIVISIKKGRASSFTVRKIGEASIGIEKIFSIDNPTIVEIKIIKSGTKGVKKAKIRYIRNISKKEIDKIYIRASRRK